MKCVFYDQGFANDMKTRLPRYPAMVEAEKRKKGRGLKKNTSASKKVRYTPNHSDSDSDVNMDYDDDDDGSPPVPSSSTSSAGATHGSFITAPLALRRSNRTRRPTAAVTLDSVNAATDVDNDNEDDGDQDSIYHQEFTPPPEDKGQQKQPLTSKDKGKGVAKDLSNEPIRPRPPKAGPSASPSSGKSVSEAIEIVSDSELG